MVGCIEHHVDGESTERITTVSASNEYLDQNARSQGGQVNGATRAPIQRLSGCSSVASTHQTVAVIAGDAGADGASIWSGLAISSSLRAWSRAPSSFIFSFVLRALGNISLCSSFT